jgi:hypothetical protein
MQGTFDAPPIVVSQSRDKLIWFLVLSLLITFFFGVLSLTGSPRSAILVYFIAIFFALCSIIMAWAVYRPGALILSPDGLIWRTHLRTFTYSWDDFSSFFVWSPNLFVGYAAFAYSRSSTRNRFGRILSGGIGSLSPGWELSTRELVALLNEARKRWSTAANIQGDGQSNIALETPTGSVSANNG